MGKIVSTVLTIALWAIVIGAVVWLHTAFWSKRFNIDRKADQLHMATTEDGFKLALHRYLPAERKFLQPVLLCHGMGANRRNFDLRDDRSLACDLAARGFDVWLLELRGAGESSRPTWLLSHGWRFGFDEHLRLDVPAALSVVRKNAGRAPLFWIGHSMGGMLGYAWLGKGREHGLCGLVTVSAPVMMRESEVLRRLRPLVRIMALGRVVAFKPFARFFSPFMGWPPHLFSRLLVDPDGMEGEVLRRCLVNLVENVSAGLFGQFLSWIRTGGFSSRDGMDDYLANLARIKEPVLIIASDADRIAPPTTVIPAYQYLGSEDKQLRVVGSDRGDDYDFGHGDILLGKHAREVIYPEIMDWLEAHATPIKS